MTHVVKMRLALQIPIKYLTTFGNYSNFDYPLTHLVLTNKQYREYYRQSKHFKLLDNGVHENGEPLPTEAIVQAADAVNADAVIPRDYFDNHVLTIKGFEEMKAARGDGIHLWPVVQGKNLECLTACLYYYVRSHFGPICIPYRARRKYGAEVLLKRFSPWLEGRDIHFLGLDFLSEIPLLLKAQRGTQLFSLDTGKPFRLAQHGLDWSQATRDIPKLDMFGDLDVMIAKDNLEELQRWTSLLRPS